MGMKITLAVLAFLLFAAAGGAVALANLDIRPPSETIRVTVPDGRLSH